MTATADTATSPSPKALASAPGGNFLIDVDVHQEFADLRTSLGPYLAPHWNQVLATSRWRGPGSGVASPYPFLQPPRREWVGQGFASDPETVCRHLFDQEGVSIAILVGTFDVSAMRVNHELAIDLARAYNDWQIEEWLERDRRLRGSIQVFADCPEDAVAEIERAGKHPQMVQVYLPTVTDRQYGEARYHAIYEAAVENGLVVSFHHIGQTVSAFGLPRSFTAWHTLAQPQAAQCQIVDLVFSGVFDRFPELKAVFLEPGVTWLPYLMWRADNEYRSNRREVPWVKRLPSEHMRDSVRLSTQPMSDITPKQFAQLVEMVESERVFMFATDYPHWDADTAAVVLPGTLPEELRRRVAYQNAAETYPRLQDLGL